MATSGDVTERAKWLLSSAGSMRRFVYLYKLLHYPSMLALVQRCLELCCLAQDSAPCPAAKLKPVLVTNCQVECPDDVLVVRAGGYSLSKVAQRNTIVFFFNVQPPAECCADVVVHIDRPTCTVLPGYMSCQTVTPSDEVPLWDVHAVRVSPLEQRLAEKLPECERDKFYNIFPGVVPPKALEAFKTARPLKALGTARAVGMYKAAAKRVRKNTLMTKLRASGHPLTKIVAVKQAVRDASPGTDPGDVVVLTSCVELCTVLEAHLPASVPCVKETDPDVLGQLARARTIVLADGAIGARLLDDLAQSKHAYVVLVRTQPRMDTVTSFESSGVARYFPGNARTMFMKRRGTDPALVDLQRISLKHLLFAQSVQLLHNAKDHEGGDSAATPWLLVHPPTFLFVNALSTVRPSQSGNVLRDLRMLHVFIQFVRDADAFYLADRSALSALITFLLCKLILDAAGCPVLHVVCDDKLYLLYAVEHQNVYLWGYVKVDGTPPARDAVCRLALTVERREGVSLSRRAVKQALFTLYTPCIYNSGFVVPEDVVQNEGACHVVPCLV